MTEAISAMRGYDVRKGQGGHHSRAELLPCRATTFGRQSPEFVVNSLLQITNALYHREHDS